MVENRKVKVDKLNDRLRAYTESRGGRVLTERVDRTKDRAEFECAEGHRWLATVEAILSQRSWCPHCSKNAKRSLDDLLAIVSARHGKLLSTEYAGVDAKYEYECVLGHRFSNSFKKVESGQWCPTCNKGRISEEVARTTFEQLFDVEFRKVRPAWLRNSRGRLMELDGANLDLGLAFEYHGAQHFRTNLYIKDDAKLQQRIADDATKAALCRDHGITLVVLTYEMEYQDFPNNIKEQLRAAGYPTPGIDFDRTPDLARAYVRDDRLKELRDLLAPKNVEVLSDKWLGVGHLYSFRCLTCDHHWQARGNAFFNQRRVAGCDRCARAVTGDRTRLNIDLLREYAASFGGELLSDTYVQRRWMYRWRCASGHEFERNFNNMAHRGQFCPHCDGKLYRPPRVTRGKNGRLGNP